MKEVFLHAFQQRKLRRNIYNAISKKISIHHNFPYLCQKIVKIGWTNILHTAGNLWFANPSNVEVKFH